MARGSGAALALLVQVATVTGSAAEVTRFETLALEATAPEGRRLREPGTAEKVIGRATVAVDPADPRNAGIADIAVAPRNAEGRVEAVADVVLLRPKRPNGTLLVELPNRGRGVIGSLVATDTGGGPEQAEDAGRAWLLERGYTLAWIGWQGDLAEGAGVRIAVPVLGDVTGPSRDEWVFDHRNGPVEARLSWPAATLDPTGARLTVRARPDDPRETPAGLTVRFLDPHRIAITRPDQGFDGTELYELTYTARSPGVMGLGFAALRDVAAFLRHDTGPANPLAAEGRTGIERAVALGVSQSGRVLRDLLHQGFNADGRGRPVFDGMMPVVAGSRRSFTNARFAQPGRNPGPHRDRGYPVDAFPFTYAVTTDSLTGRRDGLLLRCRATNTCPRVMQVDSEYELWGALGSLLTTDTQGRALALPPEVRAYMVTGAPHFAPPGAQVRHDPRCVLPLSPIRLSAPVRALIPALEAWIGQGMGQGIEPPASRYPTHADGTLADAEGLYPAIPGLPYRGVHTPAQWIEPGDPVPVVRGTYRLHLPRPDADGHALAGIRLPVIAAPRATHTAWNPSTSGTAPLCDQQGGVLALPGTRTERLGAGDPRPSLEERYPVPGAYTDAVKAAVGHLVADRLLLPEDAAAMISEAASSPPIR